MGHINIPEYRDLQKRLAQKPQAAPDSAILMKILSVLFSPEDAGLAGKLPHSLTSLEVLSKNLKIPADELGGKLGEMARRGLVFDIEHNGRRYFTLPPVVIGLFEFVFMRTRQDMPMAELARLFEDYFYGNGDFVRANLSGDTQMFRSLVREEALPAGDHSQVLDWELATKIAQQASVHAVGICQCHHAARHLGHGCNRPEETCLTFDFAAKSLSRNGLARSITMKEAMGILEKSKESGLAQIGDNVQRKVTFICNCCGCCCHVMRALKTFDLHPGIVTSNWIMEVDLSKCSGCGACLNACPVDAIAIKEKRDGERKKKWAVRSEEACLGCGVCATVCKTGAAVMRSRPQRVLVPETVFDQRIAMAIERGKLADMLFDDPGKLTHRALGRLAGFIERSAPFKAAIKRESIKSAFLNALVKGAKRKAGDLADLIN